MYFFFYRQNVQTDPYLPSREAEGLFRKQSDPQLRSPELHSFADIVMDCSCWQSTVLDVEGGRSPPLAGENLRLVLSQLFGGTGE